MACVTDVGGGGSCADGFDCDTGAPKAFCEIKVEGYDMPVEVETKYLPGVLACENPAAGPAALRAQAIAARSFLYNWMLFRRRNGQAEEIKDSEFAQVFTCTDPGTGQPKVVREEHSAAVAATSGQVLMYKGTLVAGFYSAGAKQSGPNCTGGTEDPTNSEWAITYNQGRSGSDIDKSRLGCRTNKDGSRMTQEQCNSSVGSNDENRGAMSQNGSNCLSDENWTTEDILRFYYGSDIEIVNAQGDCVGEGAQVTAEDVGQTCSDDGTCDVSCQQWFLPTINESFGMCSAQCAGGCPEASACVPLAAGQNRCAPIPDVDNAFCETIPGTVPRVLESVGGGGYQAVCASPMVGTKCTSDGQKGECIDTNISGCSDGNAVPGVCPGGSNIQCCIK